MRMARGIGGVLLALGVAVGAWAWVSTPSLADATTSVAIDMRYSRFTPAEVIAPVGVPVTFVLRNEDPIDHEWMIGDDAFHERHRAGTKPVHQERPTEVTVPAGETRTTTVTFTRPGVYRFVCHLPGHEAYGMVGVLRVVAP